MSRQVLAHVRRGLLRVALGRGGAGGGTPDLTSLRRVPTAGRVAFARDGVDPVKGLDKVRTPAGVTRLTRVLGLDIWLVTGFEQGRAVLADSTSYSNDIRHLLGGPRTGAQEVGGLGMTDPPDHTRLRRILTPHFTKHRLQRLGDGIDAIVAECLDDLEANGPVADLVDRVAFAVPFRVISDLLGLSAVYREQFRHLGTARFDLRAGGPGSFGAAQTSREFLIDVVARHRRGGASLDPDGLIAAIADGQPELTDVEVGGLADGVFLGGYETSASMLALGTYVLLRHPGSWARLRTGSAEEIDAIVEELLRYVCPVQVAFPRFARHDLTLGTPEHPARVKQGDVVVVSLTATNRDPDAGPGDLFDPTTPAAGHLAFGHGMHRCVGAELARMELTAALTGLASRFPDLALAVPPSDLRFTPLSAVYGVESLPVRLRGEAWESRTA